MGEREKKLSSRLVEMVPDNPSKYLSTSGNARRARPPRPRFTDLPMPVSSAPTANHAAEPAPGGFLQLKAIEDAMILQDRQHPPTPPCKESSQQDWSKFQWPRLFG
jgi:hypothetical protein